MDGHGGHRLDRRVFLGGSAAAMLALPNRGSAQTMSSTGSRKALSAELAEFIVGFELKSAPALAVERARLAFIDTLGVMLAGSHTEPAEIVAAMVKAEGAAPAVSVAGQAFRSSPQLAALANGVALHALDFDFTYTQGQLMAPVIPALLPLAEQAGASQAELLAAFLVGFEVCSRLSRANPNHNGGGAWHGTGTIGTIAAAAACARLLKLPAAAIPDVLGIAVSLASGVNANYGTMVKPLHAGQAARNGAMAALLGSRGFSANAAALEGRGGFFATFARGLEVRLDAFADLGQRSDLAENGYQIKRYPCGGVIHTGIDAALKLRDELRERVGEIAGIKAGIARYAADRAKPDYPTNTEAAKFNLQYVVCWSLANGVPKLASFDEPALQDPRVRALAGLMTVAVDPEFADARQNYPTRLTVTLKDGRSVEEKRMFASGTARAPLSVQQIEEKFFDCADYGRIAKPAAEQILGTLRRLGDAPSLNELWPLLRRA
jgi:2-methylcitrate dehydratase PrpD